MFAKELAMTAVLESVPGKRPKIVSDNGSQFIPKEWRQVVRHFELEEILIRVRHPESNGKIERSHRSVREGALGDRELEDLYEARDPLEQWVKWYEEERLHSTLNYVYPVDCCTGDPKALLTGQKRKLKAAAARRREVDRLNGLTTTHSGVYGFSKVALSEND